MDLGSRLAARFEIERIAGVGAASTVYRAIDTATSEPVAVKMVFAHRPDASERFRHEIEILGALDHPGIVHLVTSGTDDEGRAYLVTEWLEGEDLGKKLSRGPLGRGEATLVAQRIAEALAAAHARGIVHRDVKPANVFLAGGDVARVRLLDFGIAAAAGDDEKARPGVVLGTLGYVAPEQARGGRDVSPRADVFSLGCVLFECLAGRPPFLGDHPMALLGKVLLDDAPRVTDLCPEIPNELADLVARMLAKDPALRPADGGEVARELGAIASLREETSQVPSTRRPALTSGEMRMLSVALLVGDATIAELVAQIGLRPGDVREAAPSRKNDAAGSRALEAIVAAHGARFDDLGDGTLLLTIAGSGAATDQVARAARCALAVRAIARHGTMALATGRGLARGALPVGPVIDKAQGLVHAALFGGEASVDEDPTRADEEHAGARIRVDDVTAALLDGRFEIEHDDRGAALLAEHPLRDARTRSVLDVATVGRDAELELLRHSFAEAKSGRTRGLLVTSPPGLGKTRLRDELLLHLTSRNERAIVWIAVGDASRAGAPLALLQSLLDYAGAGSDRALASPAGFVAEIARVANGTPLVLVLDDLQWCDLPSLTFIEAALRELEDAKLLVLGFARPEVHRIFPRLRATPRLHAIELHELDAIASERLARSAFDLVGRPTSDAQIMSIVAQASGNPFFIEELARAAFEPSSGSRATPVTILAMIEARLGALDSESRRVLRAASVFGDELWLGGLDALLGGMHEKDLAGWIGELEKSGILARAETSRFAGEQAFVFRQRLFREAAYAMLTDADRELAHRLAAGWLVGRGEEDALVVAHHFEKGGEIERAVHFHRRAAEQALRAHDFDGAITRADRAVDCGAEGEMLGRLGAIKAEAHRFRGELREAAALANDAIEVLPKPSAPWAMAVVEALQSFSALGDDARVISLVDDLESVKIPEIGQAPILSGLAVASCRLLVAGHRLRAERILARIDELADELAEGAPLAFARVVAARAFFGLVTGDLGAYLAGSEQSAAAFASAGDARSECLQRIHAAHAELELGLYPEASKRLGDALAITTSLGLVHLEVTAKQHLGLAIGFLGRVDEGLALEREVAERAAAMGTPRLEAAARRSVAILSALRRDFETAIREARRAVELTKTLPSSRAVALAVFARVALARGEIDLARGAAVEAAAIYDRVQAVESGESFIRLALAEALRASGDESGGREAIRAARHRLFDRAAAIEDPIRRKSFLESVAENAWTLALADVWIGPSSSER